MKKTTLTALGILTFVSCFLSEKSNSAVLSITDATSPFSSISINPGDSFFVDINVSSTTAEEVTALTYFLQISNEGSGFFSISARDITGSQFSLPNKTNAEVTASPTNILSTANTVDLGGTINNPSIGLPGGNYFVSTILIQSTAAISPGSYTLSFSPSSLAFDTGGNDVPTSFVGYNITVIPEPTTMALLAGSLTAIMVLRRRRRS